MKHHLYLFIILFFSLMQCTSAHPLIPEKPGESNTDNGHNQNNESVEPAPKSKYNSFNIVGVDHFGRSFSEISGYKKNRQVGIFYWPWIGQPYATGIYDATKILALPNGLKILTDFNHHDPNISPDGQAHYWGEPIWGYYNSEDEWVIRKQMQMLTIAGINFIFFDTTNSLIYANIFMKVCAVIDEMLKDGWNPPKVVFYTHSHSFQTVRNLYKELYQPNRYPDTWYRIDGKPLIIAYTNVEDDLREAKSRNDENYNPGTLSPEILDFFHFLKPQWPFDPIYQDGFPWIEWTFPQPLHTQSQVMNVSVASHPAVPMSFSLTHENWINWGRGWDPLTRQNIAADVDKGTFFQAQWDHAIAIDPPMVSVGGWNEWIAYKQPYNGEYMLCDAVDKEYSRDIEPMAGGYQDAFYLQLISNIRRYKGIIQKTDERNNPNTININGSLSQWNDVQYIVRNIDEKNIARDNYGCSQTVRYTQVAPVDKLEEIRVAHDANNLYLYLKGKEKFTSPQNKENWMNILIGTGDTSLKGWECYDYIIGKEIGSGEASIEKFGNGFNSSSTGKAKLLINNNVIILSIPRKMIGLTENSKFYFKAAMGVTTPADIMNYYQSGSVMPMGRLSYMYQLN
ncbi:hypothetical protein [Proteiniphilum sp.]|uniref:hypothetical protein n=1 Tax=Proteiniphilum sp. TaxID=1926877 RepID=UPI002B21F61C|nr:hypothetical protein [Proteiniphilum sp.]MEA4917781.1 hypothetical protein [Proteiniphilum sp.]